MIVGTGINIALPQPELRAPNSAANQSRPEDAGCGYEQSSDLRTT